MSGTPQTVRRGPKRPSGAPSGPVEVRSAVLEASAKLFAEQGVSQVSLREIAREANVHVSLITRYFGSRDALIRDVFEHLAGLISQHTADRPLQQHSFERDSPLGRWMAILAHWMLTGQDPHLALSASNPVQVLADVIVEHYGLDDRSARIRSAQIHASALGWRLFETYLVVAADLSAEDPEYLHDSLTAAHQRLGRVPVGATSDIDNSAPTAH